MNSNRISVQISRISPHGVGIPLPVYSTSGAAGMDVHAAVTEEMIIAPGQTVLVPTGFRLQIPSGYEVQIRPRSGLALKHGIGILNSPGTIDEDYRGEVKIILSNFGSTDYRIRRGDRIAQMVLAPVIRAKWEEVPQIEETDRGAGGFGHTGT